MSGAEILGIVLGVLPLVISGIEHYDDALRPFIRYRKFSSKLHKFHDELETERTIFRTECLLLLASAVSRDVATEMLNDRNHPSWKDNALKDKFGRQLGSLGVTCSSVISQMEAKLGEISRKSEELSAVASQPTECEKIGDKKWRHRVGKKLKFSFSEVGLERSMAELRKLNKAFLTLSNQVVRLDSQWSSYDQSQGNIRTSENRVQSLDKLRMVQKASVQLYESLTRACSTHPEHLARLCLETKSTLVDASAHSYQIRFSLGFTHTSSGSHADSALLACSSSIENSSGIDPSSPMVINLLPGPESGASHAISGGELLWFEVESVIDDSKSSGSQARPFQPVGLANNPRPQVMIPGSPGIALNSTSLVINRSQDLCSRLGTGLWQSMPHQSSLCIGLLDPTSTCQHLIYRPSAPILTHVSEKSISLAEVVTQISSVGRTREIPQFQRLHLAKSLALAVLQFHTTPWLAESWHSDAIHFFDESTTKIGQRSIPSSPYLNVRVLRSRNIAAAQPTASVAPNPLLFRLGVIFLELAYGSTFRSLRESRGPQAMSVDSRVVDFVFARQLADEVGPSLGLDFACIIRKCLRCDFGCGEDLEDPLLQAQLYEDVVCKLDSLEQGFRRLQSKV